MLSHHTRLEVRRCYNRGKVHDRRLRFVQLLSFPSREATTCKIRNSPSRAVHNYFGHMHGPCTATEARSSPFVADACRAALTASKHRHGEQALIRLPRHPPDRPHTGDARVTERLRPPCSLASSTAMHHSCTVPAETKQAEFVDCRLSRPICGHRESCSGTLYCVGLVDKRVRGRAEVLANVQEHIGLIWCTRS